MYLTYLKRPQNTVTHYSTLLQDPAIFHVNFKQQQKMAPVEDSLSQYFSILPLLKHFLQTAAQFSADAELNSNKFSICHKFRL